VAVGSKSIVLLLSRGSLLTINSAFKFLPILGQYVADSFESIASAEQKEKWKWLESATPIMPGDGSRGGPPRRVLTKEEQSHLV
jgi:sarcosine oxidase/L-pipecolate oxidase